MSLLENLAHYRYVAPPCMRVPEPLFGLEWMHQPHASEIPHPRMHPGYYLPGYRNVPIPMFGLEWMMAPSILDLPWPACAGRPSALAIAWRMALYAREVGLDYWWYGFQ